MPPAAASPFDAMVGDLVRGVVDDAKMRLVDGVRQTLDGVKKSATRKLGSAGAGAAVNALQATGIVLLDERIILPDMSEIAVVLGRRASKATPLSATVPVPAGRYRAVVVLVPEE